MPKWENIALGVVGFLAGYYAVKHFRVSGGRVI